MDVTTMQNYCLARPGAWADNPWDHEHPVVKVGPDARGKIFAFLSADGVGVKAGATREVADEWLERFPGAATVMAYIGRSGWNDLAFSGQIPDDELLEAVDESYRLVVSRMPEKHRPHAWDGARASAAPGSARATRSTTSTRSRRSSPPRSNGMSESLVAQRQGPDGRVRAGWLADAGRRDQVRPTLVRRTGVRRVGGGISTNPSLPTVEESPPLPARRAPPVRRWPINRYRPGAG